MSDIDDPFKPSDATILRPRPGAGRRGSVDALAPQRAVVSAAPRVDPIPESTRQTLGTGLNALVRAASPLLLLAGQLRATLSVPDVASLRRQVLDEIRRFEARAHTDGVSSETLIAARYALCAALDEAVLSTPWGAQSEWAQQPLLVALHREAWGGEKFFEMLERISQNPDRHAELLELQYLCLALGFSGKYQVLPRGDALLAEVKSDLYNLIRTQRDIAPADLSLRWQGVQDRRHRLIRYVPLWVVAAATLAVLAVTFVLYYTRLEGLAAPVHARLASIGLEDFAGSSSPAPAGGPTLKELLASDEAGGRISVEQQQGRTVLTVLAPNLFASGSAMPDPAYGDLFQRISEALNKVPGRVLVIGHTDDQPLKSLRYQNNFELSRERAVSVVRLLQRSGESSARFEWTGVGSSEPRYRPESDPENRARNRRVEIIHVP